MPSSDDDEILRASTFHDWWIGELRSSLAPTAADTKPPEPEPEPASDPRSRTYPRSVLAFACACGLFAGALTMVAVEGRPTAHASPTPAAPAAPAAPAPRVEGIVEVGEIIVVNPSRPADPPKAKHKSKSKSKRSR